MTDLAQGSNCIESRDAVEMVRALEPPSWKIQAIATPRRLLLKMDFAKTKGREWEPLLKVGSRGLGAPSQGKGSWFHYSTISLHLRIIIIRNLNYCSEKPIGYIDSNPYS